MKRPSHVVLAHVHREHHHDDDDVHDAQHVRVRRGSVRSREPGRASTRGMPGLGSKGARPRVHLS
eukprot:scaffold481_cov242-Prasinococcus_capsulatus_cf.AAC.2